MQATAHQFMHYLEYCAAAGATDLHPMGRRASEWLLRALDLSPGLRVLEVGCGAGATMARILRRWPAAIRLDGVDALPAMLRAAGRRLRAPLRTGAARLLHTAVGAPLPCESGAYDRVYTESVVAFQDAAEALRLLAEIARVLKPGGRYVANEAVWLPDVDAAEVARINEAALADFGLRPGPELPWCAADWLVRMRAADFEVLEARTLDEHAADEPPRLRATLAAVRAARARHGARGPYAAPLAAPRYTRRCLEARLFVLRREGQP